VIVIRTMGVQGKANGLLHQEHPRNRTISYTATPKAKVTQGVHEYMETILHVPVKKTPEQVIQETRERNLGLANSSDLAVRLRAIGTQYQAEPLSDEPYHVVTGFQNQQGAGGGVWRLHFIFDPGPKEGTRLLTLLDETHSVMLFTLTVPDDSGREAMFKAVTPLQRVMQNQLRGSGGGLWAALEDEDDL